ncbi:titin homolog [Scleropages formosus]|uniref:titin homolog n=1 Tax=Scleropages formosus TaxID=113540 RepID=UPI0010FA68A5|nr:titin homolog [Scleropages formosus]
MFAEMNTHSSNQNESHAGGPTVGRSDSPTETNEKEGEKETDKKQESRVSGESSTNQKTAETENLDQNDTQTGTDVTQSAGETDGETQSERRDTDQHVKDEKLMDEESAPLKTNEEINTGSWSKNTLEDDSKTVRHLNSPAETLEKDGVKVKENKSKQKDNSKSLEQNEQKLRDNEKESEKVMDLKMKQENQVSDTNTEMCSQDKSTVGSINTTTGAKENEATKMTDVDKTERKGSAEMNTDSSNRNDSHVDGQTVGRSDKQKEKQEKGAEDPKKESVRKREGSAGESSTNQKTAETENLDQNDTQTGTDVTQSAGETDGETQSERRDTGFTLSALCPMLQG